MIIVIIIIIINNNDNHNHNNHNNMKCDRFFKYANIYMSLKIGTLLPKKNIKTVQENHFLGAKSMIINSQLNISIYLNSKKLINHGSVLCCNTVEGVLSINNLISNWSGKVLSIFIISAPSNLYEDDNYTKYNNSTKYKSMNNSGYDNKNINNNNNDNDNNNNNQNDRGDKFINKKKINQNSNYINNAINHLQENEKMKKLGLEFKLFCDSENLKKKHLFFIKYNSSSFNMSDVLNNSISKIWKTCPVLLCTITVNPGLNGPNLGLLFSQIIKPISLDFFYIDVFFNYDNYLNNLLVWFKKIQYGGIILGSRYLSQLSSILEYKNQILPINKKMNYFDTMDKKLLTNKDENKNFSFEYYTFYEKKIMEYEINYQISIAVDQFSKMMRKPPLVMYVTSDNDDNNDNKNKNNDNNNNNKNNNNDNENNNNNNNNNNDINNNNNDNNKIHIIKNIIDINHTPAWYVIKTHTR